MRILSPAYLKEKDSFINNIFWFIFFVWILLSVYWSFVLLFESAQVKLQLSQKQNGYCTMVQ